jgi:hypothetical protein
MSWQARTRSSRWSWNPVWCTRQGSGQRLGRWVELRKGREFVGGGLAPSRVGAQPRVAGWTVGYSPLSQLGQHQYCELL